ncbi:MAG: PAS domain S-box protein [Spirochaetes bacterium]|nr:PAS domain S-box protein [Spirochaetota bacterium]
MSNEKNIYTGITDHDKRWKVLIEHSTDIIAIIDQKGTITFVSPSVKHILGYEFDEVVGKNPLDFIHPDDIEKNRKFFLALLRSPERLARRKIRLFAKDGHWRLFEVTFKNLVNEPSIAGVVINSRDITEKKEYENLLNDYRNNLETIVRNRTEELLKTNQRLMEEINTRKEIEKKLREQSKYLLALHSTALSIIDRLEITDLLKSVVENASTLLNAPHSFIALLSNDRETLVTRVGTGIFQKRIGDVFYPGQGVCGTVWKSEKPVCVEDYRTYPNRILGSDLDALQAVMAVPLTTEGKTTGVICIARDRNTPSFEENEVQLLCRFAEITSIALDNARLYERLQKELEARKKTEESLWESNEKYQTILETIEDGYYEVDLKGNITFVNSSMCRILGYPMKELVGISYRKIMDEKNARDVFRVFNRVFLDKRPRKSFDWELIRKDGLRIAVETSISLITDREGTPIGFRGILRDISERKKLEQSLQYLAHHDPLTGLPNRTLFNDRLQQAIAHASRNFSLLAVLFLDLDNFKEVNDNLGHDVGDLLLKEVARRLEDSIREIDTVARFGGDEFVFILPDIKTIEFAEKVIKRIHGAFSKPFHIRDHSIIITPSMGASFYPIDSDDMETLLKKADSAQYRAKETGKNNYKFYSATMQK